MTDQPYPERKKIRLHSQTYAEPGTVCSITVCTANRAGVFAAPSLAKACVDLLRSQAEIAGVAVHAYCFMPDHLHLLLSPSGGASTLDFTSEFKSLSTRLAWQHGHKGAVWQTRYYDHFLRRDEDIRVAVSYILNNPVRKGMVAEWNEYPYCGSLVYDLEG